MRRFYVCVVAAALAIVSVARAQVTGTVKLDGTALEAKEIDMSGVKECADQHADPVYEETVVAGEKGELANVVISVKTDDPSVLGGEVPKETAVLDQKACQYVPHVLPMMVGQELVIKNDDPFLHNVHSLAQTNPAFNFGQPNKDPGKKVDSPKAPEVIKVKCDVHPWMGAWIVVLDHPFYSATKEDGTFAIKDLPDGEYTLQAWHEKFGTQEQKVEVKDGKGEANFTFKASSAQAEPANVRVLLASASGEVVACEKCKSCCESGTPTTQKSN